MGNRSLEPAGATHRLTRDEAGRIAINIAKFAERRKKQSPNVLTRGLTWAGGLGG